MYREELKNKLFIMTQNKTKILVAIVLMSMLALFPSFLNAQSDIVTR